MRKSRCLKLDKNDRWFLGILSFTALLMIFGFAVIGNNLHLCINDNLESNIPIFKMIKDNNLFWKFEDTIPFLHGDLTVNEYPIFLSAEAWIYMLLSPLKAYIIVRVVSYLASAIGFWAIGKETNIGSAYVWGICGALYGLLGTWPHAALAFASIPLLVACFCHIYLYDKSRVFLLPLFVLTINFALLGLWICAYLILIGLIIVVRQRKVNVLFASLFLTVVFVLKNYLQIKQNINNVTTIKSLVTSRYDESFVESLRNIPHTFIFDHYYHAGGGVLKYVIIPVCIAYVAYVIFRYMAIKKHSNTYALTIWIFVFILLNTIVAAFDNNIIRNYVVPFLSGLSFSRLHYISPFLWLLLLTLCILEIQKNLWRFIIVFLSVISMVWDPMYYSLNSMYNDVHFLALSIVSYNNNNMYVYDNNHEYSWDEFYSEQLFKQIKNDIDYNNEWVLGYGIDPGILEYNGFCTSDGYYSGYSLAYHEKFERLISPQLKIDAEHCNYWQRTGGYRAVLYSLDWDIWTEKNFLFTEGKLNVDAKELHELSTYIVSRVIIINADDLGIRLIGTWSGNEFDSPYDIYVYYTE